MTEDEKKRKIEELKGNPDLTKTDIDFINLIEKYFTNDTVIILRMREKMRSETHSLKHVFAAIQGHGGDLIGMVSQAINENNDIFQLFAVAVFDHIDKMPKDERKKFMDEILAKKMLSMLIDKLSQKD